DKGNYRFYDHQQYKKRDCDHEAILLQKIVVADFSQKYDTKNENEDVRDQTFQINGVREVSRHRIQTCGSTEQDPEKCQEYERKYILFPDIPWNWLIVVSQKIK